MKQEKKKPVPVDPNVPENPVELLVNAVTYLGREIDQLAPLARDGANCLSATTQTVIMTELDRRLNQYRERGLQALVHITNEVVALHNRQVDEIQRLMPKPAEATDRKEASDGMGKEDAHAGVGEGDVRREDEGVAPVGAVEAAGQGDADRGGTEKAPQGELRAEGEERLREGEVTEA